jgi:phosphoserine phosphatase RsbU/P
MSALAYAMTPSNEAACPATPAASDEGAKTQSRRPARVLVVDDDAMMRKILARVLDKTGYQTLAASDARAALCAVEEFEPEVIITDLEMPGMDGLALCRLLQDRLAVPAHIIILSGHAGEVVNGLEAGAADYMHKPFVANELLARVSAGIRTVEKQRALLRKARGIEASLVEVQSEQAKIGQELFAAAELQSGLLPPPLSTVNGIDIACAVEAHSVLSGDMVGIEAGATGQTAIFSLDVSGKGTPAALLATLMTHEIRNSTASSRSRAAMPSGAASARPSDILAELNQKFLNWANSDRYSTLAYARIDRNAGMADIGIAGHPRPALIRANGSVEFVGEGSYPIGMLADAQYRSSRVALAAGDRLALFSDGFIDSRLRGGRHLGYDGMAALLRETAGNRFDVLTRAITDALRRATNSDSNDDTSIIIASYR